jgi:hypothetical protein
VEVVKLDEIEWRSAVLVKSTKVSSSPPTRERVKDTSPVSRKLSRILKACCRGQSMSDCINPCKSRHLASSISYFCLMASIGVVAGSADHVQPALLDEHVEQTG